MKLLSHVRLFATPWTVAHQVSPSMGFSRQEYWSGLPVPSPGDLPDPGIEPRSPALQADALNSEPPGKPTQRNGGPQKIKNESPHPEVLRDANSLQKVRRHLYVISRLGWECPRK